MSKAEKTRQYIIEKTAPLFNGKGYAGTSLTDLTRATGLTKGSIYGNFGSKDEVALAAFDHNLQQIKDYIREKLAGIDTAPGKLLAYAEAYRNYTRLPFLAYGCPVMNTATEADDTHPLLREKAAAALREWTAYLENIVRTGQHKGEIRPDTSPAAFATVFMALIEGGILLSKATGNMAHMNRALDHLAQVIRDHST